MRAARAFLVVALLIAATPGGAQTATASPPHHVKGDPLEGFNRRMYAINQALDKAIFRPLALGTREILPKPVRNGLRNFLRNLTEPIVFLNDVLQLKPKRAFHTLARFVINSTAGIAGLLDVAVKAKLPHHNNGLGNTLARYGVGPGPYLFLPFIGPTDLRDLGGGQVDRLVLPLAVGKPFNRLWWQLGTGLVSGLQQRSDADADLEALMAGAADPYATLRSVFLQNRLAEIREVKGQPAATSGFDDPLSDPAASAPSPPPATAPPPEARLPEARLPETPQAQTPPIDPLVDPAPPADSATPEAQMPLPKIIALAGAPLCAY